MNKENLVSGQEVRTFLALELPVEFQQELGEKIKQLQQISPRGIKWVKQENLHITMQFLGNIERCRIEEFSSRFLEIFKEFPPFTITNPKIEVIPPQRPRLIWVKCDYDSPRLVQKVQRLRDYLTANDFQIDKKPFKLHITLGRVKIPLSAVVTAELTKTEISKKTRIVRQATFYESRLTPEGPEYNKLASYDL